jgi:ABC-2 type transport system permease protein
MTATIDPPVQVKRPSRFLRTASLGVARGRLEIRQFLRAKESVVFSFMFPIVTMIFLSSAFPSSASPGVKFSQYLLPGLVASSLMIAGFSNLGSQIPVERDRGVLKRLAGTPMPKSAYFIGKVIMVVVTALAAVAALLLAAIVMYDVKLPASAGQWITFGWVSLLGVAACTLCGIAISSVPRDGKSAPALIAPIVFVLQFISGVFIVSKNMPEWLQTLAALLPLKWMCQGLRSAFLGDAFGAQEAAGSYQLGRVALILSAWVVVGLVLCLLTFRWTKSKAGG